VGIVTSLGAAALQDVLTALRAALRMYGSSSTDAGAGVDAPPAIAAALQARYARAEVDTLLLVRGGGSLEDLWAFNDERVVRAHRRQPHPGGLRRWA